MLNFALHEILVFFLGQDIVHIKDFQVVGFFGARSNMTS